MLAESLSDSAVVAHDLAPPAAHGGAVGVESRRQASSAHRSQALGVVALPAHLVVQADGEILQGKDGLFASVWIENHCTHLIAS